MADKKYIEREAAIKTILGQPPEPHYPEWYYRDIKDIPAADVAPVVHARWITEDNTEGYRGDPQCTACKGILDDEAVYGHTPGVDSFFFCPKCGAKMDGERKEATP